MTASDLFANYPELDHIARDGVLGFMASTKSGRWERGRTPEIAAEKLARRTIV